MTLILARAVLACALAATCHAAAAALVEVSPTRSTQSLNGTWQFLATTEEEVPVEPPSAGDWIDAPVPSNYRRFPQYGLPEPKAKHAWYRKIVRVPEAMRGRQVGITFQSVAHTARVWCNGALVATNEGGWLPFHADCTPHIRWGADNEVIVFAGGMSTAWQVEEGPEPLGWGVPDAAKATLQVRRDPEVRRSGKASLRLESVGGPAKGSASHTLRRLPTGSFTLRGSSRGTGRITGTELVLQVFNAGWKRQLAWIPVPISAGADWAGFSRHVSLPADTAHVVLHATMAGEGKLWLDELAIEAEGKPFHSWDFSAPPRRRTDVLKFPVGTMWYAYGINDDVALEARPAVRLADPAIVTSVADRTLALGVDLVGAPEGFVGEVRVAVERDGEPVRTFPPIAVPAGRTTLSATWPWADPQLWSPLDPVLYTLRLELVRDGAPVDVLPVRFGFREVAIRGTEVLLNGRPLRLFGSAIGFGYGPDIEYSIPQMRSRIAMYRDLGWNYIRAHNGPMPTHLLALCDEAGMLVEQESALFNPCAASLKDPVYRANAKAWIRDMVRRDRNHPSIIIWSVENEHTHVGADLDHIGELVTAATEVDPSRPAVTEGCGAIGGRAAIFTPHYSVGPGDTYDSSREPTVTFNRSESWTGDRPFLCGEMGFYHGRSPQWAADWVGEAAFRDLLAADPSLPPGPGNRHDLAWNRAIGLQSAADLRNMRVEGVMFGMNQFAIVGNLVDPSPRRIPPYPDPTGPGLKPVAYATDKAQYDLTAPPGRNYRPNEAFALTRSHAAPVAAFWRDQTRTAFAGGTRADELVLVNDSFRDDRFTVSWGFQPEGGGFSAQGERTVDLPCGGLERLAVSLTLPAGRERLPGALVARIVRDGALVHERRQALTILPAADLSGFAGVALLDPTGKAGPPLTAAGLRCTPLADLAGLGALAERLLVIAPGAVEAGALREHAAALREWVARGGRVLQLEQAAMPDWLPYRGQLRLEDGDVARGFRVLGDDLLGDLGEDELDSWGWRERTGHRVAAKVMRKPLASPVRPLVQCRGNDGLDRMLVARIAHGDGAIVISQLEIVANLERSPAAGRALAAILGALQAPVAPARRLATNLPRRGMVEGWLDTLGDGLSEQPVPGGVWLVSFVEGAAPVDGAAVTAYRAGGGTVWLHGLHPGAPAWAHALLPSGTTLAKPNLAHQQLELTPAGEKEAAGASNSDLFYVRWGEWNRWKFPVKIIDHALVVDPATVTVLASEPAWTLAGGDLFPGSWGKRIDKPLAGLGIADQGRLIIDQVRWDAFAEEVPTALNLPSALLARLGVRPPTAATAGGKGAASAFRTVDLRPAATTGFRDETADDRAGGWTDQGDNDLRDMPTGRREFANIPFDIIDPATNADRACIVVGGEQSRAYFPRKVTIPIDAHCTRIHFLHTCAWAGGVETAFTYRIRNELMHDLEFPVRVGREVDDWWKGGGALEGRTERVKVPSGVTERSLYVASWTNPHPDRRIIAVTVEIADPRAVGVVLGLTLANEESAASTNLVPNGAMSAGGATPEGWQGWNEGGRVTFARDTTDFVDEPAALRLELADGPAKASASTPLAIEGGKAYDIGCTAKTSGALTWAVLALQVFDGAGRQLAWIDVARLQSGTWKESRRRVTVPEGAKRAMLQVYATGEGIVQVDQVVAEPAAP